MGYRAALEYGAHRWTFTRSGCVCLRWSRASTRTRSARTPPRWRFQRIRLRPTVQLSTPSTLVAQSCFRVFCVAGVLQGNERRAAKVAGKGILAHTCTRTHAHTHMHMHMRTHPGVRRANAQVHRALPCERRSEADRKDPSRALLAVLPPRPFPLAIPSTFMDSFRFPRHGSSFSHLVPPFPLGHSTGLSFPRGCIPGFYRPPRPCGPKRALREA